MLSKTETENKPAETRKQNFVRHTNTASCLARQ